QASTCQPLPICHRLFFQRRDVCRNPWLSPILVKATPPASPTTATLYSRPLRHLVRQPATSLTLRQSKPAAPLVRRRVTGLSKKQGVRPHVRKRRRVRS